MYAKESLEKLMYVLGIDVGFSATERTSAFCLLRVDSDRNLIEIAEQAQRFGLTEAVDLFRRLSQQYGEIRWVSVDAPLTPVHLQHRPRSGRSVDKRFSRGEFTNSKRGPQPGSIAVPRQGWPLYEAGMVMAEDIREARLGGYVSFENFKRLSPSTGLVESIPKLTQALLAPPHIVRERAGRAKIDDYLFPLLFAKGGPQRSALDRSLGDYELSEPVEAEVRGISLRPRRYHEELAAIVAAVQGVLLATKWASIIGCVGDSEGYFALPRQGDWNPEWFEAFNCTPANGIEVIDLDDPLQ